MEQKVLLSSLKTFYMSEEEFAKISELNRNISQRYLDSLINNTKGLSKATIKYNARIMGFVLRHIKNDFTNLTVDDIDDFVSAVSNWQLGNGMEIAASTKKQYYIGFKRFLYWYGRRYNKKSEYRDLAELIEVRGKSRPKQVADMLTDFEIKQMILATDSLCNKAMIAVLAECGCRMGELVSCRIKDLVEVNDDLYRLTFPTGKTGSRNVVLCQAKPYLREYLKHGHHEPDNPEAALWEVKMYKSYKAMGYSTIYNMIKQTAAAAGITKRVHPHLFRHTAATRLIGSGLSEPRVKNMLGWTPSSNMTAVYVHLDDKDLVATVNELNGLVERKRDSKGLEVGKCPKCWEKIPTTSKYCFNCGAPLTEAAKSDNNLLLEALTSFLKQYPEAQTALMQKYIGNSIQ